MFKKVLSAITGGLMTATLFAVTPAPAKCPKEAAVLEQVKNFFKFDTELEPLEAKILEIFANRRVTPFTDEWIRHHIDKNFKLNLELLGVD